MRKLFIVAILLNSLLFFSCKGQDRETVVKSNKFNKTEVKGVKDNVTEYSNTKQEPLVYYYLNGIVVKEIGGLDNNGYPIGIWEYFTESGLLDYRIDWDRHYITMYYENGKRKEEGTFISETGVHIGKWITYNISGEIEMEFMYDEKGEVIN